MAVEGARRLAHSAAVEAGEDRLIDASFRAARESTRRHARSFYFSSFALPGWRRRAAYAVYAFCRHADDSVDRAGSREEALAAARAVGSLFDRAMARESGLPFEAAFAETVGRFGLEREWFIELAEGVARDRGTVRTADWPELRDYCYHVASVVGLMMAAVFGLRDSAGRERAIDLGLAMQLTNILRDVGEDYRADRIYLPADELRRFGLGEDDLRRGEVTPAFRRFMVFQVERAREIYDRSEVGIRLLADDGSQLAVWVMRHVYAGILDEIERADYDVFGRRAATGFARKLVLAYRAWRSLRRSRRVGR
jgi:phytoene synthase